MSYVHYQDSQKEKTYLDFQQQQNRVVLSANTPRNKSPAETYQNGHYVDGRTSEFHGGCTEVIKAARGDHPFPDTGIQTGRIAFAHKHGAAKYGDSIAMISSIERMQARLKFLEDSNVVTQTRNQNLITENRGLTLQLEEEKRRVKEFEERITSLREELDRVRIRLEEAKEDPGRKRNIAALEENGTSTTNIISKFDRGVQVWAVCKGCQRKLESCEKQPPTVTITKAELESLERDMQTLRDAIIDREEAWDKAMERERNYRQQLTRLTAETITARHLSETRYEELQVVTSTLSERELELKSIQKDNLCLNKLVAKMYNLHQRGLENTEGGNLGSEINEKDQRLIEEIVRRVSSTKGKQKPKSRSNYTDKTNHSNICQGSPRENKTQRGSKDQAGSLKEAKR